MATHSSILAWRIPGMGEPVGLPSMGLHWVRHDWSDLAAAAAAAVQNVPFCGQWLSTFFFFLTAVITFAPSSQGHSQDVGNPQRPDILIPFLDFQESVVWCPRASIVYISYNLESARASLVSNRKESACDGGDQGSVPGLGRSPGEGMATHSSTLAWRVPWTEEPGGVQFMGWQRVRHDREPFFLSWVCHNKN